jgi:PKD repeat protein
MKNKKAILRLIAVLGLLVLLIVPAAPAAAVDPTVSISPAVKQVTAGGSSTVAVNVDTIANFDAAQYDITYNPAVIDVTGVTAGNIGGTAIPVAMWGVVATGPGTETIRVINNVPNFPGANGTGSLAVINFTAVGAAGQSSTITFSNGLLGDKDAEPISVAAWQSGTVSIVNTPVTDFTGTPTQLLVGQTVTFTSSTSGGSLPYTYAWDFGDSGTSNLKDPTHSYASAGTYTVALTVTDSLLNSDTETETGYITVYPALVADATADKAEVATVEVVTFGGSATGGKPGYTYAWDFGDSGTSNLEDPTYNYADAGTYTVTLTVTDALGNTDTDTVTVIVNQRGDANKNGTVDINDVTYVEHIIMDDAGYLETPWADANNDGTYNALDITATELIMMALQP